MLALAIGHHPIFLVFLVVGVLLPEADTIDRRPRRSWVFHTFLPPTILYQLALIVGIEIDGIYTAIHLITVGVGLYLLFDFVYPKNQTHPGAEWPVWPSIWSAPWGLMWLGLSWFAQWFLYLSVVFLPWLFGIPVG